MFKKLLYLCVLLFCIPLSCHARIYHADSHDLTARQKKIGKYLLQKILSSKESGSNVLIENVATCSFDELVYIIRAMDQTYFPYKGSIEIPSFCQTEIYDDGTVRWSIRTNPKKIRKYYKANKKDHKIMKRWTKRCVNSRMSKKQKAVAIAKYIARNTRYKVDRSNADSILRSHRGNCNAFAHLYKQMCQQAGIKSCRVTTGYYKTDAHAWNTLKIGKKRYYTDSCFYWGTHDSCYLVKRQLPGPYQIQIDE